LSNDRGTLQVIARHLVAAVEPLTRDFRDAEAFRLLMWRLGWDVEGLPPTYVTVADAAARAVTAAEALADDPELGEVFAIVEAVGKVYRAVDALGDAPPGMDPAAMTTLARNLFEYLLADYLFRQVPKLFSTLELLGVIRFEGVDPADTRPGFVRSRFEWERLPSSLLDPGSIPSTVLGWGTTEFNFPGTAELLGELTLALGLPSSVDRMDAAYAQAIQGQATGTPVRPLRYGVTVPFFDIPVAGRYEEVGLMVTELPAEGAALPGLVIVPLVPQGIAQDIDLGNDWRFRLRAGTDLTEQLGVVLRPGEIGIRYPFAPGHPLPSGGFGFSLEFFPESPVMLLGEPDRIRLELGGVVLSIGIEMSDGAVEFKLAAAPRGLMLVLSRTGLDGFLTSVLGDGETRVEMPLGISWSSHTGLDFLTGAGFELSHHPHLDLGLLHFDRIDFGMRFVARTGVAPQMEMRGAVLVSGTLGPIAYSVDQLGVHLPIRFQPGNAGPFDIDFSVLLPRGMSLSIDSGAVTGGGFMFFDSEKEQYAGGLYLEFKELTLNAIGLLTTRLPDSSQGYSLLVIITAEGFAPIQLGFGFTLNGVGGLFGVNRTIAVDAMRAGLRNHSLDSILFPPDPIHNATRIVSDIRTLFPPAQGRYVFGPMAIIGYGTPPLIEAELAIILELPDPVRLVILGQVTVTLPRKGTAIMDLHLDVLGIIDFGAKLFSLDARLHDSKISFFNVFGDMALRLSWGAHPNFALSIGGLHPRYQPPPGFPELRRVTVALGTGRNPRLTLQGYLALTSNSLQFGARAELYAEAAGFNLYGWVQFDALFIFSPFSFLTEFTAGLALRRRSSVIASIQVDAALSGPSPWRARGRASISLLFFRLSVGFDATFGSEPRRDPPIDDPWEILQKEIAKRNNWSPVLPPAATRVVAVIEPPSDGQQTGLLDPVGGLTFHQRRVPLDHPLVRFGQGPLPIPRTFTVQAITVNGQPIASAARRTITDLFAPAQFDELSDADKLTRPSFDRMTAGLSFGADTMAFGPADAVKGGTLRYRTTMVDGEIAPTSADATTMTQAQQLLLARHAATAGAPSSTSRPDQLVPDPLASPRVVLAPERYTVVAADDLVERGDILAAPTTKTAAAAALAGWLAAHPHDRSALHIVPTSELAVAP
jgi:hypothetical protein